MSTVVRLEFGLTDAERTSFYEETGISTNDRLPVEITFKKTSISLSIKKSGRGEHQKQAVRISNFISSRISLLYIPAVRTGRTALDIADSILKSRRSQLIKDKKYRELVDELDRLDREAIDEVGMTLENTLKRFIPSTNSVRVDAITLSRSGGLRDILIDDGALTPISNKGDGIQSLVALALTMEWTKSRESPDKQLIVAMEEPESHLHPGAVHELKIILQEIAETQQVLVTTHSQALVNRTSFQKNVVVGNKSAKPASDIDKIRNALGVNLSDALSSAEITIITEGEYDQVFLTEILSSIKPEFRQWIDQGRVVVESAGSGSKIYGKTLAASTILTYPVVFIDGDKAGLDDVRKILSEGLVKEEQIIQIKREGFKYLELEDLIDPKIYLSRLQDTLNFKFTEKQISKLTKDRSGAWSERLESILNSAGMPNAKSAVKRAKFEVSQAGVMHIRDGEMIFIEQAEPLLERLYSIVEKRLSRE